MVRDFTREAVEPQAEEHDRTGTLNVALFRKLGELGLLGVTIPAEHGGAGEESSPVMNAMILEELAHGDATLAMAAREGRGEGA
jgi:isovaleryl-CoA dehydrogenase